MQKNTKMPSIDDWIGNPLGITDRLFDENDKNYVSKVVEYFKQKMSTPNALFEIPSMNDVALHNLKTNTLVRFRCMVQDMYDPEYYLGMYEVKDIKLGQKSLQCGMWKDMAQCGPHKELLLESSENKTMDRQTLYCIPLPGENKWTKDIYSSQGQTCETPSTSSGNRTKRSLDDDEGDAIVHEDIQNKSEKNSKTDVESMETGDDVTDVKRSKTTSNEKTTKNTSAPSVDLNFPISCEKGPACLVKLYDEVDQFKVNDMVEFVGIISNDPAMVEFPEDRKNEDSSSLLNPAEMMMDSMEQRVHHPPPSLVPRLHVILANRHTHSNPLLPSSVNEESINLNQDLRQLLDNTAEIRQKVITLLQDALFGDILAAEYMLCHIVSNVYARHDVTALGKFALNIRGCPKDVPFPANLYTLLNKLLPKSCILPLTVPNLNNSKFIPCKDYTANRLTTGKLQLSDNTQIFVDETVMKPGQLDANGVRNLTALGNVITWQKVEYDFNYHKQDFVCNLPVLVMSEGKSLLGCDCHVTLSPTKTINNIEEHFQTLLQRLTPTILQSIRTYLGLVQLMPYNLPESVQKDIENDFVDVRKENPDNMTIDDFQTLLILARLVSISHGKSTLTMDCWEKTKQLEQQRKRRMQLTAQSA